MNAIRLTLASLAMVFLFGCAGGATKEGMTYNDEGNSQRVYPAPLKSAMSVAPVTGGKKTNPAWTSEIDNTAFEGALKDTLAQQGLLAENGRYQLTATFKKVDAPTFGFDMKVTTFVQYILRDSKTGKTLMNRTLEAPYTATVGDAFAAVKRLRLANEGSGRANIEALLNELAKLKINSAQVSLR